MKDIKLFLGRWLFVAEKAAYEHGEPPQAAIYQMTQAEQTLTFTMLWKDAAGKDFQLAYSEVLDGEFHALEEGGVADEVRLQLTDDNVLVSEAKKGDTVVMLAEREVISETELRVTMAGKTPDGTDYKNVSWYQRMPEISKMDAVRQIRREAVAKKIALQEELQQVAITITKLFKAYMGPQLPDSIALGPSIDDDDPDETVYHDGDLTYSLQVQFATKDGISIYDATYAYQSHISRLADGSWNLNVLQENHHLTAITPEVLEPVFDKMYAHMQMVASGEQEQMDEVRRLGFKLT